MVEVRQTPAYAKWFSGLEDRVAKARIDVRIRRWSLGNPGDVKSVGGGVSELRVDHGPSYRVYFCRHQGAVIVLLAGGNKSSQARDIEIAKALARNL
jgi:putative addiction module killer protein